MSTKIRDYIVYGICEEDESFSFGCSVGSSCGHSVSYSENYPIEKIEEKKEYGYVLQDESGNIYPLRVNEECVHKESEKHIKDIFHLVGREVIAYCVFFDYSIGCGYKKEIRGTIDYTEVPKNSIYQLEVYGFDYL